MNASMRDLVDEMSGDVADGWRYFWRAFREPFNGWSVVGFMFGYTVFGTACEVAGYLIRLAWSAL